MKKKLLFFTALFSFVAISNAQELNYGLKIGGNLSNLNGNYPDNPDEYTTIDNKSKLGFHIGGFVEYKINDKFSIQPELLFSTQGNKLEIVEEFYDSYYDETEKVSLTQNSKFAYLNLPIIFKYQIVDNLSIEFGPQVGFLASAKADLEYKDYNYPSDNENITIDLLKDGTYEFLGETIQVKKGMNRIDFGLNLGASYDFTENIFVQGRYYYGLTKVDKNSTNALDYSSWNLKNSVFQISLGYRFK